MDDVLTARGTLTRYFFSVFWCMSKVNGFLKKRIGGTMVFPVASGEPLGPPYLGPLRWRVLWDSGGYDRIPEWLALRLARVVSTLVRSGVEVNLIQVEHPLPRCIRRRLDCINRKIEAQEVANDMSLEFPIIVVDEDDAPAKKEDQITQGKPSVSAGAIQSS
ncbi:hypothetical protein KY285_020586 [Solanum tuberosum]|nr:hypothetical protein KY285_020586 [Solanum tuberosum]